jgi:hypothetical protein
MYSLSLLTCPDILDQSAVSPRPVNDAPIGLLSIHLTAREKEVDFMRYASNKIQNGRAAELHGMSGVHYAKVSFDHNQSSCICWLSANSLDKYLGTDHERQKISLISIGHKE